MRPKGISVIIPNYNGIQLLNEILPSVTQALFATGLPNEIIISDDCSTDDSLKMIAEKYPEIILIESTTNKGFSPTINKGIFASKYEYLLLLNNDVKLEADYFKPLLRYFELPDTFGVMGRIIGWNDNRIQDGGKYPEFHGAKIKTSGNYIPVSDTHNGHMYSMYLSGANALVSGEKLIQLGGFDELFAPFYVEDFELSVRAWRLGWKCYYEHEAICRHKLSVTIKSKNKKKYINRIYYRNKMYLHAIHLEGIELFFWYLQLFPEIAIRLLSGRFYFLQSFADFLSTLKKMKASKLTFNQLASAKGKLISFKKTVKAIQQSLSEKNIKRF